MTMDAQQFPTLEELRAGLDVIYQSPKDDGVLEMIVRRPQDEEREVLEFGELNISEGLVGDKWHLRRGSGTTGHLPNPETQLTLMNSRAIQLIAQRKERWKLAGDQLFVDLDLSDDNLPPGTRLKIGSSVIEVSSQPHTGCKKFMSRFGVDALKFVNLPLGKQLNLRGINAKVVEPGEIHVGDRVKKV
jgi:MOSC domain-containing protein YiiM